MRDFRDHVHRVLAALADGEHPGDESISALNDCAAQAHSSLQLDWRAGGAPAAVGTSLTTGTTRLLADLATDAITLAAGPDDVVRCVGPDCRMLFVKTHPRRRFCDSWRPASPPSAVLPAAYHQIGRGWLTVDLWFWRQHCLERT